MSAAIKVVLVSITTAILAAGCVAFPDDDYDRRGYGYGHPGYRYDRDRERRYERDNNRRWERKRAYDRRERSERNWKHNDRDQRRY